jgi:hypothetical protein
VKRFAPACLGFAFLASCGSVDLSNLDDKPNVGPCPVSASLYDASRIVEINGTERHENVAYTGAIEGIRGFCRYVGSNPITMEVEVDFAFGKGPKADAPTKSYPVFVTVTRRDKNILAKERFNIEVAWPAGKDVVRFTETIPGIEIPRANDTISGSNFEIIVGFDLTPEQLAYNRSGTRFTINVAPPAGSK